MTLLIGSLSQILLSFFLIQARSQVQGTTKGMRVRDCKDIGMKSEIRSLAKPRNGQGCNGLTCCDKHYRKEQDESNVILPPTYPCEGVHISKGRSQGL